ncbi:hypothetical protein J1N10_11655 [Carboxylicivirga sp. A043]|uniref:hypothetical protein n=1 Tax=Carboxylicivirga litoralis TaxID=2816963 RepID=UPI0021CB674F|nr:hypothetical protein [Carboxylicivirga sp. A043]MCU4156633.1 hypothetical protein [Carboxylicivirga sp. A043]
MKHTQLKYLCLLILIGAVIGCEQEEHPNHVNDDVEVNRFFDYQNLKSGASNEKVEFTNLSIDSLKAYNDRVNFIPEFVDELGYSDWENARYFTIENENVLQVPVYNDADTQVQALIISAFKDNYLQCYVIRRGQYDAYVDSLKPDLTLEKVIDLFILADFKVFGQSDYLPNGNVRLGSAESGTQLKGTIAVQKCYTIEGYVDGELVSTRYECETTYVHVWENTDSGSGGGGSDYSGFDGGSGGGTGEGSDSSNSNTITKDPCEGIYYINTGLPQTYIDRLKELRQNAKYDTEHATIFYSDGTRDDREGAANGGTVDMHWRRYRTVDMMVHNHTKRAANGGDQPLTVTCFSATDVGLVHDMLTDGTSTITPDFVFMVIHDKATYILQIDDKQTFIDSNFHNRADELMEQQEMRMQNEIEDFNPNGYIDMDQISREVFTELFGQYGISLLCSSNNNNVDFSSADTWYHITQENPHPSNRKNKVTPCNN